jgi:hypothetical protein
MAEGHLALDYRFYAGGRHEICNEPEKDRVHRDIGHWLSKGDAANRNLRAGPWRLRQGIQACNAESHPNLKRAFLLQVIERQATSYSAPSSSVSSSSNHALT